jgi:hypothetical protein
MVRGQAVLEVSEQFRELLRKVIWLRLTPIALKGKRREGIGARRAADPEINSSRKQSAQHAERFGDLERTVMGKHDATGADAHRRRESGDGTDQSLWAWAREHRRGVMLRDPIAMVAERFGELCEINAVSERVSTG